MRWLWASASGVWGASRRSIMLGVRDGEGGSGGRGTGGGGTVAERGEGGPGYKPGRKNCKVGEMR